MVKWSIFCCKRARMAKLLSVSSNNFSRNIEMNLVKIITDKLRSYNIAHRELVPNTIHDTSQYANNRAELPHQQTRIRKRGRGWSRLNDSWMCLVPCTIYLILAVIECPPVIIGIWNKGPLRLGKSNGSLKSAITVFRSFWKVNLAIPIRVILRIRRQMAS